MKRKLIIIVGLGLILSVIIYNYLYQDHRNIAEESSAFIITAADLSKAFNSNADEATMLYLNKTIEITGTISQVAKKSLILDHSVFCSFTNEIDNGTQIGNQARLKGRLIGFDELLQEIKIDQCHIIN